MSSSNDCPHNRIFFGSRGMYIFCRNCEASWAAENPRACATGAIEKYDRLPEPKVKHEQQMARGENE